MGYYRRLIWSFASISATFQAATSVTIKFCSTVGIGVVFKQLKAKLTFLLVLAFSNFENAFIVKTDASAVALEAVLAQKREWEVSCNPVCKSDLEWNEAQILGMWTRGAGCIIHALKVPTVSSIVSANYYNDVPAGFASGVYEKDVHGRLVKMQTTPPSWNRFRISWRSCTCVGGNALVAALLKCDWKCLVRLNVKSRPSLTASAPSSSKCDLHTATPTYGSVSKRTPGIFFGLASPLKCQHLRRTGLPTRGTPLHWFPPRPLLRHTATVERVGKNVLCRVFYLRLVTLAYHNTF